MIDVLIDIQRFYKRTKECNISIYSAYATLFILMAIFPFIMVLLTLIQYLPISPELIVDSVSKIMPDNFRPIIEFIVNDLMKNASSKGTLLSITVVTALWSASRGVIGILRGLNAVYRTKEQRNYILQRILATVYTLIFVGIVIVTLTFLVFGNRLQFVIMKYIPMLKNFNAMIVFSRSIVTILLLALFFMVIYKTFPNVKTKWRDQVPGALFASVGWMVLSFFFSIYVDNYAKHSYMYGSLTTIVLLILWLYFCMNLIFIGGSINEFLESYEEEYEDL